MQQYNQVLAHLQIHWEKRANMLLLEMEEMLFVWTQMIRLEEIVAV